EDEPVGAGAGDGLVAMGDDGRSAAGVGGYGGAVVGRRHGAGRLDRDIGRDAGDDRGVGVVDGDGLDQAVAVAANIGGLVSAFEGEPVGAGAGDGLVAMGDGGRFAARVTCSDGAVVCCR